MFRLLCVPNFYCFVSLYQRTFYADFKNEIRFWRSYLDFEL